MEENVWRQKFLACQDVKEKRRQVLDEFGNKTNMHGSHLGYTEEDERESELCADYQERQNTSPSNVIDYLDMDSRDNANL